jgi:TP901 family phage tail tape measure protein
MQPIQLPVTQVGLEQSIQAAMKKAAGSAQINLGTNSRQINALSQPLGRITGQADEFTKSMAAANARVLAFGASAGIMAGVSKALAGIVTTTIKVEKSLANINSVLNVSSSELQKFGGKLFDVAKNTGQTFDQVAEAATELARQGLGATETLKRLNDALILSRLSGLDAAQSVEGLTAAYNSFATSGITTSEILNKLVVVSQKFAVSEKDLIEGLKRSASVANQAGVSLDELIGVITAVQEKTARGGAVIGNSFKTIFARIQDRAVLADLQALGVTIEDAATKQALPATTILRNLATSFTSLSKLQQADIAKKLGGVYQLSNLLAAVQDLSSETSKYTDAVELSRKATDEAYRKNAALNNTLEALINKVTISAQQLGNTLGEIGVTDNLKNIISFFNGLLEGIQNILGQESALGGLFRGLAKGIGAMLSGPGLALFGAIILKLSKDLVQFGFASLKSFFGIGKAAKEVKDVEMSIQQILTRNVDLQQRLFALEGNRAGQLQVITSALIQQEALLRKTASTASSLGTGLYNVGGRATPSGLRINPPTAAGGYVPAVAKESSDINRGVGGARSGDKPVVIPNFNFGGGKRGSMVAHTGEYIVPNFAGKGSAVFNRDMVKSMGLPSGAQKINAAGGFIPNFARPTLLPKEVIDAFNPEDRKWYEDKKSQGMDKLKSILANKDEVRTSGKRAGQLAYTPRQIKIIEDIIEARQALSTISFDASKFAFTGGRGIGLIGVSGPESASQRARQALSPKQIDILNNSGITDEDALAVEFTNIKTNSLGSLKNLNVEDAQRDFQKRVNSLFGEPLRILANDVFGSLGSIGSSGDLRDKYLFGNDTIGNIFESAINLYAKKAEELDSFNEGEAARSQVFDFNMNNAYQADRINRLFFNQIGGVGRADAKKRINSEELRSVIDKSINDPEVRAEMKKQAMTITASKGFIPNFANPLIDSLGGVKRRQKELRKAERRRGVLTRSSALPIDLSELGSDDIPDQIFRGVRFSTSRRKDFLNKGLVGSKSANRYGAIIGDVNKENFIETAVSAGSSSSGGLQPATTDIRVAAAYAAGATTIMSDSLEMWRKKLQITPLANPNSIQKLGDLFFQYSNARLDRASAIEKSIESISGGFKRYDISGGIYEKTVDPNNFIKSNLVKNYYEDNIKNNLTKRVKTGSNLGKEPLLADLRKGPFPDEKEIRVLGGFGKVDKGYLVTRRAANGFIPQIRKGIKYQDLDILNSSIGGSTGAKLVLDKISKQKLILKSGANQRQVFSEARANSLFGKMGENVPNMQIIRGPSNERLLLSSYIEGQSLGDFLNSANETDRNSMVDKLNSGYAKTALLADWDWKGLNQDNIIVDKNQNPFRVDVGGALDSRAQGGSKAFGSTVTEMDSLKARGGEFFKNLSKEQIQKQIDEIVKNKDYIIAHGGKYREMLKSRIGYLKGYIPNFAKDLELLGRGAYGSFYKITDKIGVKKFNEPSASYLTSKLDLKYEYAMGKLLSENSFIPSVTAPKILSTLQTALTKNKIRKQIIPDPVADKSIGEQFGRRVGRSMEYLFEKKGIIANDLHGENFTLNENSKSFIEKFISEGEPTSKKYLNLKNFRFNETFFNDMNSKGGRINIIDTGYMEPSTPELKQKISGYLEAGSPSTNKQKSAAGGYLPNFANPLQAAVGREMAAGVPASQIYIDKSPSLKSAANPMGLMVANRRDEPAGGFQGINRAMKEGRNPQTYGAASGFIPNYAKPIPNIAGDVAASLGGSFDAAVEDAVNQFGKKAIAAGGDMDKLAKVLENTLKGFGATDDAIKKVVDESRKQAEAIKQSRASLAAQTTADKQSLAIKILSDQKNKQLASQLDKIYAIYNKSAKTKQDLADAEKQVAAVLKTTTLKRKEQKAIIGSTDTLAANSDLKDSKLQKTTSDYVGKLFLLQSVTSALTGIFSELGETGGKVASAFAQVGSSYLSYSELSNFKKKQQSEPLSEAQVLLNDFATARRSGNAAGAAGAASAIAQRGGTVGRIASTAASGGRLAGLAGGTLGVISKVGPLFSKFVPVLGQAITIFQAANSITKIFGLDLTVVAMKGLKSFGQALGLVATDAEKTAESFRKSRIETSGKILSGDFGKGDLGISGVLTEKLTEARKEEIKKRIGDDAAKDATNEELLKKDFDKSIEYSTFQRNQQFIADIAGLKPLELAQQYSAGKGLQTNRLKGYQQSFGRGGYTYQTPLYERVGLSDLQFQSLSGFEADLATSYSSKESQKAFEEAQKMGITGAKLQPFFDNLLNSAYENLEKQGKGGQVQEIKQAIAGGGDLENPKVLEDILSKINNLTKTYTKEQATSQAIETANLAVLQKRLEASLSYQQSLFEVATSEEISLGIRKDMLGLSKLETMEAESKLETIKLQKQATLEQAKASTDLLKNSEVLNARLNEAGLGLVTPESFEKVAEISEEINQLILEQGGYTAKVEVKARDLLESKLGEGKASESILAILKATNEPIQKNLELQKLNTSLANAQKASLEAINFLEEKRRQSASSYYNSQSRSFDLSKRSIDIELEKFKIEKEREKIGKNAAQVFAIDKEIVEKETATINARVQFDKQAIINDLRKQFSDAALELGLNLEGDIKGASSLEQFQKISEDIANKERQVQIDKIKASITELSAYKVRSDYFKNAVTEAADYLSEKIKPKDANFFSRLGDKFLGLVNPPVTQRRDDVKALEDTLARLSKSPKAKSPLLTEVENAFKETELQAQEAANQIGNLNNSLIAAGANLTTFSNLVANVFRDLSDQITQNAFGLLTVTDASSISAALVESEKFEILRAGPQTPDTIKNAENRKALLFQELEVKKAITAEDRVNSQFELSRLEEILALKEEALAAETSEERLKILDKIIAKERERAPLGARLSAIISTTQEEKIMRLEDTLVSASKAFRDNIVDALTNAIDQGGDLGEILRSAAYDYVKALNRESIGSLFDSALNAGKTGIAKLFASGGRVTGGSGSKDDVPAMLMGGEYVINKNAVRKYGPQFFDSINNGQLSGFAEGGKVPKQRGPQGNFYTPGTYGTGAIEGKRNLLDFATQSGTSGQFDRIVNMQGYQSISLEPESSRLTVAGMRNSPAFEATQSAKQQAFDLYLQQYQQEQEAKRAEKEQKKAFRNQLIMLAATAAIGGVGKAAMIGGKNAVATLGKDAGFLQKAGAFAKGSIFGGDIGSGIMGGGLKNLFSGNFGLAYQSEILKALPIGAGSQNAIGKSIFSTATNIAPQMTSVYNQSDMTGGNLGPPPADNQDNFDAPSLFGDRLIDYWNLGGGLKGFNKATGGMIPSTSGIDTVPAMLSGGEFIMNRAAVENIGAGNLQSMNSGTQSVLTDEASKEMNEKLLSKLDELIEVSSGGGDITINVSGSGNETTAGDNNQDASSVKQQLAREVKDAVLKVLDEQKRLGGRLRR